MSDHEDLSLNEIEGISNYAAFVKAGKEEFNKTADKGVGMTFWILGVFFCLKMFCWAVVVSHCFCVCLRLVNIFFELKYMFEMIYIIYIKYIHAYIYNIPS